MKKYKYPFYNRISKNRKKETIKQLDKVGKRNLRINKFINFALAILYFLLVGSLIVLTEWGRKFLNGVWLGLFKAFMIIMIIILPFLVLLVVYKGIYKKIPSVTYKDLTKEAIGIITKPLFEYYNISSDYIVTKCYSSTETCIENKDVIVFAHDGKLRIVNDLFHSINDFGCYEFEYNDLTYYHMDDNGIIKTIIKTTDSEFILGYKAKAFIKRTFEK